MTVLGAGPAAADGRLAFAAAEVDAAGVNARDVRLVLSLTDNTSGELHIGHLALSGVDAPLTNIHLQCGRIELPPQPLACLDGRLQTRHPALKALLGTRGITLSLRQQPDGAWQLTLPAQALAQGRIDLDLVLTANRWTARGALRQVDATDLLAAAQSLSSAVPEMSAQGRLTLRFDLRGEPGALPQGHAELSSTSLTVANTASTLATDALAGRMRLDLAPTATGLRIRADGELTQGYAYAEPLLQDYGAHPVRFGAGAFWSPDSGAVELQTLDWDQREVLKAKARARWDPAATPPLQALTLDIEQAQLPGLYTQLLLPLSTGTPLDELESSGRLSGTVRVAEGRPQAIDLTLDAVHLDDSQRRFAIYGLAGNLAWRADGASPNSALTWDGAYWRRMPFGAARWAFQALPDGLRTLAPIEMDFFDGRLRISQLDAAQLRAAQPELKLQAALEPVSLPLITAAFGWPSLPGELSGQLPLLHYRGGELVVDGQIEAQAFGGRLTVDDARLQEPLGRVPRLQADIRLRDLDLAQVTSVFDVGRIEGALHVDVLGLRLEAWQPVAFDARLYTPPGTSQRRRISQRAVENIAQLGGGGAVAALSAGFMRFFETFAYKRIAWSCTLRDGICQMGGGKPAEGGGFLLVEGRGLPQITVVGYSQRVSWPALLGQLSALSASPGASVE